MTLPIVLQLDEIIRRLSDFEWNNIVYMQTPREVNESTPCVLMSAYHEGPVVIDGYDDAFRGVVSIVAIRDVIENAKAQGRALDTSDTVLGLAHYVKYDAFPTW